MSNNEKGLCPRCNGNNIIHAGLVPVKVGKTRSLMTDIYICGKCSLVFYEYSKGYSTFK